MAQKILAEADIIINGERPWDLLVHDDRVFDRVFRDGSLGFGEVYMDGWWDSPQLDQFFAKLLRARIDQKFRGTWRDLIWFIGQTIINRQNKIESFKVGEHHYDRGNDLYEAMLDRRLVYTCGYWKSASNLDEAQEAKLDLVCRKIGLRAGQKVLDIGCGWGSFARFAAEKYGASVVGVTISKEQAAYARESCKNLPVEIFLKDYRDIKGLFDHVISLGMFEHVGYKNYRTYMQVVRDYLKDDGLFLLHTIGQMHSSKNTDSWFGKYIFPNSMIPSATQIMEASEDLFVLEDWHSFGSYYDRTLMAWFENFNRAWPRLKEKYGERFYRMWKYYLLASAGSFRARKNNLWQIVFSKEGVARGYESVR